MKISASIYSSNEMNLEELVGALDECRVDYFHIDCLDDETVFKDIRQIKQISRTPIDLHIITSHPEKFFQLIADSGVEMVTFQHENLTRKIKLPTATNTKWGLAITSETPIDVFADYETEIDFALFMATKPGYSGGNFNKENFKKIREFQRRYRNIRVHVDGGVNDEISFVLRNMGVYAAVSGSFLVNAQSIGAALGHLKSDNIESHLLVRDFMMSNGELPLLKESKLGLLDILQSIEKHHMGFTILTDEHGKMTGISSNADVRRGLIANCADLNKTPIESIINRSPIAIHEHKTINELLEFVKSLKFPILYLPVVDSQMRVTGAIKFNNLIKGES